MSGNRRPAVVFYARDFLSVEFARMGRSLMAYKRVYIVVSDTERRNVELADRDAVVLDLGSRENERANANYVGTAFNNDRYLRSYSAEDIAAIVGSVEALCQEILAQYDVRFFLDEPVSGFPNVTFNARFAAAGAICLHFQTSWVPGYMFFSSDPAHACIRALNVLEGGDRIIHKHIENRSSGGAVPLYVLNYSSIHSRLRDAAITWAKAAYRKLFRRREYYLDRDVSAHLLHCRALLASLRGGYLTDTQLNALAGRYVLFPLHYEPEAVLNYFSAHSRQEEIAEQMLDVLPLGYELILKEHPSQPGALNLGKWRTVTANKRVLKVRGDVNARSLLRHDIAVISIGSTLAIEAALAGKPVGVLGQVHFATMPGIRLLSSPRELNTVLGAAGATRAQIEEWYGRFLNTCCFEGNIMKGRTSQIDLNDILSRASTSQIFLQDAGSKLE